MQIQFTRLLFVLLMCSTQQLFAQNYNLVERSYLDWPGQTLANVCGWASPDGKEYALLGGSQGLIIVDVTNPDAPVQIVQIPGPNNLWKEIKVYKHYAYITSEGGGGIQIVDLSGLPSANLQYKNYLGTGALADALTNIHALHIDTAKAVIYAFGGAQTGATCHSIAADPYNPVFVGQYQNPNHQYVHDGYVNNDTLYAGHIYAGVMDVVDMKDKNNPVVLGSVTTPNQFTHNCWPVTNNRHILLTTDERSNSFLAAYDTQDPQNIVELDRLQTTPGSGSIVHNTHVRNNYAISSWYTDGVNIVDATRPINLVEVASFDTYPAGSGDGFDGCWGVFPFLPSGNIITTNIGSSDPSDPTRMYVLTPNYKRACYLEGAILDGCDNLPLKDAQVKINSNDRLTETASNVTGIYRTGQVTPGTFTVTISKPGYVTTTRTVNLATAQITELNLILEKSASFNSEATATLAPIGGGTASLLANKPVQMIDPLGNATTVTTSAAGKVTLTCAVAGTYKFGIWGAKNVLTQQINSAAPVSLAFQTGYYDDFEMDFNWTKASAATSGGWVRAIPVGTQNQGVQYNPGADATSDTNEFCYTTGNGGGAAGDDDVDNGGVTLTTPVANLTGYANPVMNCQYWFANGGGNGGTPNDLFEIRVNNGSTTVPLFTQNTTQNSWQKLGPISLKDKIAITSTMTFEFYTADSAPGHLVEAAVDIFSIEEGVSGTFEPTLAVELAAQPNPFARSTSVRFERAEANIALLEVTDVTGNVVSSLSVNATSGAMELGENLPTGVYFVRLRAENAVSAPIKIVKQ
jgi:choice-of-anchor B domain-containing protein